VVVVCSRVILELSEICFCKLYFSLHQGCVGFWMSVHHCRCICSLTNSEFDSHIWIHYSSLSFVETEISQGARPGQYGGCRTTVMTYRPEIPVQTKPSVWGCCRDRDISLQCATSHLSVPLGCDTTSVGNWFLMFWGQVVNSSVRAEMSKK